MPPVISVSLVSIITLLYLVGEGITNLSYLSLALFNSILTLYAIFAKEDKPFSLHKFVNLFIYIFYIVANGIQFARSAKVLTFVLFFGPQDFVAFQLIMAIILCVYNGMYAYWYRSFKIKTKINTANRIPLNSLKVNYNALLLISLAATIIVLFHYRSNPTGLIFRGTEEAFNNFVRHSSRIKETVDNSGFLLFDKVIRPLPFVALLLGLLLKAPRRILTWLFLMTLITNFPASLARNAAAMIWLPIIVLIFKNHLKHNVFMWFMMFGIFVLFPFFNLFRRWNGNMDFEWSMDFLNDINFDASQIFMAVMKLDFVTYGKQLLGALLFFFPRRFWPTKPVGSGHELVTTMNGWFSNVSMPFFAEGYVNFGFIGVLLFVLFAAWGCAKLDCLYWFKWRFTNDIRIGYYLILLGATTFIMRGDLMSSLAYTVGIMASYTLCLSISTNFHFTNIRLR